MKNRIVKESRLLFGINKEFPVAAIFGIKQLSQHLTLVKGLAEVYFEGTTLFVGRLLNR